MEGKEICTQIMKIKQLREVAENDNTLCKNKGSWAQVECKM